MHAAAPVAAGLVAGLYLAIGEIRANAYLSQGLWRTSLWIACRYSLIGAIAGVAAGLYTAMWGAARRGPESLVDPSDGSIAEDRPAAGGGAGGIGLAWSLAAMTASAILLLPSGAPDVLGVPARWAFPGVVAAYWALVSAFLLSRAFRRSPSRGFEGAWTALVWLGYIVAFTHVWARLEPGPYMVACAFVGLLAVLAVHSALQRHVEVVVRALGRNLAGERGLRRLGWTSAVVLSAGGVLWSIGWVVEVRARASLRGTRPNLIIIAIDTLRADRTGLLSVAADRRDLTPNLTERLAGRGTVFSRAYSQAPWTMPAFASIFTGLYPEEHAAQRGADCLLPRQLTLAELLRDAGYRTMAVVSGEYVSSRAGMLQGFDRRDESQVLDHDAITSSEVTDRALAFLSAHRDEPFFLFAHYFDPHWVYRECAEFEFATAEWSGPPSPKLRLVFGIPDSVDRMTASDRARLAEVKALYAEDIAFADLHIGRLLAALDEDDLWDTTCVVVVADHGEEFLEHGGLEHGQTLFNEVVHVPLLVADPSRAGPEVVSDVVETRWLFGTILDMLGVGPSAARGSAHSLFAPQREGERYARSSLTNSQSCLIGSQYKLIKGAHRRRLPPREHGFEEASQSGRPRRDPGRDALLFDLHSDPEESLDLSSDLPEIRSQLQSSLDSLDATLRSTARVQPMPRLNRDQLRRLRNLGYL